MEQGRHEEDVAVRERETGWWASIYYPIAKIIVAAASRTHQSSDSSALLPAELWNLATPELEALVIVALAAAVIPMEGPPPEALASVDSVRVCCIWVLAAASRVEVST